MEVFYNGKIIKNNQFLKVSETQIEPEIKLNMEENKLYTLIFYDPDAIPDALGGTYIHWTIVNITNNDIKTGNIIIPYKGPCPPMKTGKHHYIFNLYEQNGENKISQINKKQIEINQKNGVKKPIYEIEFISENEVGGRKQKKTKKRQKKDKKKTKKRKLKN
jgi:phosphatidylethanolamine-binding protein (PEBP) family uncharacterized protein